MMMSRKKLIVLSGPMGVGKSTMVKGLTSVYGFECIKSSPYLIEVVQKLGAQPTRENLQYLGDELDLLTDYKWVFDLAEKKMNTSTNDRWVFDAVRKRRQVEHFKVGCGKNCLHLHLTASEETLRSRYASRLSASPNLKDLGNYEAAVEHPNELEARSLIDLADHVINLDENDIGSTVKTIIEQAESVWGK